MTVQVFANSHFTESSVDLPPTMFMMEALILSNIFVSTPIMLERKVLNTLFTLSYCLLEVLRGSQIKLIHTLFDLSSYHSRNLIFKLAVRLPQADLVGTQITVAPFLP